MSSITLKVSDLIYQVNNKLIEESKTFENANLQRVDVLLHAIQAGELFAELYDMFHNTPNSKEIVTDMGTYKGWTDFLKQNGFNYNTVSSYIFMYKHRQEFKEMRLTSKNLADIVSGAAGHRKIAAIKAVKWYLQQIAIFGEQIRGTLTACDYQQDIQNTVKKVKENKYVLREDYERLKLENQMLRLEIEQLRTRQLMST